MESALCAWRLSSGDTSCERATARLRLAHRRILSGSVLPAQFMKSVMLWRLVSFMSSPASSSSSSSTSSAGALLASRRSIINWRNPSSADNFVPPPNAISRILYTAYPSSVFSPERRTLIWFSPSHFNRLTNLASIFKMSALTVPSSCWNSNDVLLIGLVNTPQEWCSHLHCLLSRIIIGFSIVASFSLERITVYVHSAGFFSSGVALKSKTGIFFSPFVYSYIFMHNYCSYCISVT